MSCVKITPLMGTPRKIWIWKRDILGTAHLSRKGEYVDFRPASHMYPSGKEICISPAKGVIIDSKQQYADQCSHVPITRTEVEEVFVASVNEYRITTRYYGVLAGKELFVSSVTYRHPPEPKKPTRNLPREEFEKVKTYIETCCQDSEGKSILLSFATHKEAGLLSSPYFQRQLKGVESILTKLGEEYILLHGITEKYNISKMAGEAAPNVLVAFLKALLG
jgi:hypothetical protein